MQSALRRYVTRRSSCSTVKLRTPNIRWYANFVGSPHSDRAQPPAIVLQPAVDAFGRAAFAIANIFRNPMS